MYLSILLLRNFDGSKFVTGAYRKSVSRWLRVELQSPRKIKCCGRQRRSVAFDYRRTSAFFVRPINRTGIGNWLPIEHETNATGPNGFQIYFLSPRFSDQRDFLFYFIYISCILAIDGKFALTKSCK